MLSMRAVYFALSIFTHRSLAGWGPDAAGLDVRSVRPAALPGWAVPVERKGRALPEEERQGAASGRRSR